MFEIIRDVRADAETLAAWFAYTARAIENAAAPRGPADVALAFCEAGEVLDGDPATLGDVRRVELALNQAFAVFQTCGLITKEHEERTTARNMIPWTAEVARLTPRGLKAAASPRWRLKLRLGSYLVGREIKRLWRPFAKLVAVLGVFVTLMKVFFFWRSEHAAIALLIGTAVAFVATLGFGRRDL